MNELQSLSQIFQNKLFRIPDYQRGYAWLDSQLRDFWEDLINLQVDRYHYTGLLSLKLLSKQESKKLGNDDQWLLGSGYNAYHIVDGQQRLTTFVILLNEIISFVRTAPENTGKADESIYIGYENLKDIRNKYICRTMPPADLVTTYMFGYENDNPSAEYLKYKVFGQKFGGTIKETYYTKNLKYAKSFFAQEIQAYYDQHGMNGLAQLYQKLTLKLMFNIHEIQDDYDVFVAFETMNNRGKKLTNLELLKNRLIYLTTLYSKDVLDEQNEIALRETINSAWKEVYYQLGRNEKEPLSDDEFLRAHWIMYFTYSRKKGDDYIRFLLRRFSHKSIFEKASTSAVESPETEIEVDEEEDITVPAQELQSDEVLTPKDIADYVNSLKETAEYWYYTFFPEECSELSGEEKLWIDRLNRIGIGYFRPIIAVSLIRGKCASTEQRVAFFKAVERFIFLNFRMAMYQSSYKSSDYYRFAKEIYYGERTLEELTAELNTLTDENADDVTRIFVSKTNGRFNSADGFYSWRDLKYFLYEYEYELASKYKIEKLTWADLTKVVKDKITVEHILPQTPTKLYWRNQFRQFSPDEKKTLAASLGNLLPLSQSINSSLQNDSFPVKKTRGYENGSHSEIEVSRLQDWDAQQIYERGMRLLDFMEKRWDFKFASPEQKEELLHISFVHEEREIPAEINEEEYTAQCSSEAEYKSRHELRKAYWEFALPYIRKANINADGTGPYSKVSAGKSNYIDGFFGIQIIHLYCKVNQQPQLCSAGLWIDCGDEARNKKAFDFLHAHREEIEARVSMPIVWDRKDGHRACSIDVILPDTNIWDRNDWPRMAQFQAKMTKELADYVVHTYEQTLKEM